MLYDEHFNPLSLHAVQHFVREAFELGQTTPSAGNTPALRVPLNGRNHLQKLCEKLITQASGSLLIVVPGLIKIGLHKPVINNLHRRRLLMKCSMSSWESEAAGSVSISASRSSAIASSSSS